MEHYQVTLTTGGTVYNLLALIRAANSTFKDFARQIIIQMDDGNAAAVHFGNSAVSTANYGIKLVAADESISLNVPSIAGIHAVSGTNAQKLNISIFK